MGPWTAGRLTWRRYLSPCIEATRWWLCPINWYHDPDSRVNPVKDTIRMVRDVLKIRINGWRGVYKRKKR